MKEAETGGQEDRSTRGSARVGFWMRQVLPREAKQTMQKHMARKAGAPLAESEWVCG